MRLTGKEFPSKPGPGTGGAGSGPLCGAPAAAPSYPLFPCPGTKARPAFAATPQCRPAPSSGQSSPPLSTPHPSRPSTKFPSIPGSLGACRRGRGLSGNLQQLEPPPRPEPRGEKAGGEWGGASSLDLLPSPHLPVSAWPEGRIKPPPRPGSLGSTQRPWARGGEAPRTHQQRRSQRGAGTPRPRGPQRRRAGPEPRLCSGGEARGGRHSRGRRGGGRVRGGAREPPTAEGRVLVPTLSLVPPATFSRA